MDRTLLHNSWEQLKNINSIHVTEVREQIHWELCKFVTFL